MEDEIAGRQRGYALHQHGIGGAVEMKQRVAAAVGAFSGCRKPAYDGGRCRTAGEHVKIDLVVAMSKVRNLVMTGRRRECVVASANVSTGNRLWQRRGSGATAT